MSGTKLRGNCPPDCACRTVICASSLLVGDENRGRPSYHCQRTNLHVYPAASGSVGVDQAEIHASIVLLVDLVDGFLKYEPELLGLRSING